jgi:glucoamylase
MSTPFTLHFGFDGWQAVEDRPSVPIQLGMHAARLAKGDLLGRERLDFTFYFVAEARWEGRNHHVRLTARKECEPLEELRAMAMAGGNE